MPELPEVETIVGYLNDVLPGKRIKDIRIFREKNILSGAPSFQKELIGESFLKVTRRAKFLIFHLTDDKVVIAHLRMEGKYYFEEKDSSQKKHDILIYDFMDGSCLHYNDVRTFGTLELSNEKDYLKTPSLSSLGKEPFLISPEEFFSLLQKKGKHPIKQALLDQSLIVGIGNIYASEILFASQVNPRTPCKDIPFEKSDLILKETKRILFEAISQGGSTIRSYHPKEGISGKMQNELQVYGQANKPCPRCKTPIRRIFMNGRSTFYCPLCQKQPGHGIIIGVTGPIASGKSTVTSYLSEKGFVDLDSDRYAHESYEDKDVKKELKAHFPGAFSRGHLDRKKLLSIISKDEKKTIILNSIIHPYVYKRTEEEIKKHPEKNFVIDMPLLLASPFLDRCDFIIGVNAPLEVRKERLKERGVDIEKALKLNSSFPIKELKKAATIYLETTGSKEESRKILDSYAFLAGNKIL